MLVHVCIFVIVTASDFPYVFHLHGPCKEERFLFTMNESEHVTNSTASPAIHNFGVSPIIITFSMFSPNLSAILFGYAFVTPLWINSALNFNFLLCLGLIDASLTNTHAEILHTWVTL